MAGIHQSTDDFGGREHGLHFTNDVWNNTITNGDEFILHWNETIDAKLGTLGLFKVTYPSDGVVVYEVAQNITSEFEINKSRLIVEEKPSHLLLLFSLRICSLTCEMGEVSSYSHPRYSVFSGITA